MQDQSGGATERYDLGHADGELTRLRRQARVVAPITRRLFESAGIGRGMRVLDVGSGAGDVALLLADLVGPTGEVVGIDRAEAALATAQSRAEASGDANVSFEVGDPSTMTFDRPFDAVVGRYVLMPADKQNTAKGSCSYLILGV